MPDLIGRCEISAVTYTQEILPNRSLLEMDGGDMALILPIEHRRVPVFQCQWQAIHEALASRSVLGSLMGE